MSKKISLLILVLSLIGKSFAQPDLNIDPKSVTIDRDGKLFFYIPSDNEFKGKLNPTNPVIQRQRKDTPGLIQEAL
ncbi:MAG: hypothetical protein KAS71_08210 [Bacteroidales bacterium]|nr:hypothetical protein [Bacteroidales bacterium]